MCVTAKGAKIFIHCFWRSNENSIKTCETNVFTYEPNCWSIGAIAITSCAQHSDLTAPHASCLFYSQTRNTRANLRARVRRRLCCDWPAFQGHVSSLALARLLNFGPLRLCGAKWNIYRTRPWLFSGFVFAATATAAFVVSLCPSWLFYELTRDERPKVLPGAHCMRKRERHTHAAVFAHITHRTKPTHATSW